MPTRYHPALVTLHWLIALLIVSALVFGFFVLAPMPNTAPDKVFGLRIHMIVGVSILALMLVRVVVRLGSAHPPKAMTGNGLADRLAPLTHWGFYVVVLLMVGSGIATSFRAGLPGIVFGHDGRALPASFDDIPPFEVHATLAFVLTALIVLHVGAALYHHVVLKDGLFRRMAYGRR